MANGGVGKGPSLAEALEKNRLCQLYSMASKMHSLQVFKQSVSTISFTTMFASKQTLSWLHSVWYTISNLN